MEEPNEIDMIDDQPMDERLGAFLTEDCSEGGSICDFSLAEYDEMLLVDTTTATTKHPDDFLSPHHDMRPRTPPPPTSKHDSCEAYIFFSPCLAEDSDEAEIFLSPCVPEDTFATQNPYQKAIDQLRASMKRSEETRRQILCNQILLPLPTALPDLPPTSIEFFTGSRSTLTAGLEQSRAMLFSYVQQSETL